MGDLGKKNLSLFKGKKANKEKVWKKRRLGFLALVGTSLHFGNTISLYMFNTIISLKKKLIMYIVSYDIFYL